MFRFFILYSLAPRAAHEVWELNQTKQKQSHAEALFRSGHSTRLLIHIYELP